MASASPPLSLFLDLSSSYLHLSPPLPQLLAWWLWPIQPRKVATSLHPMDHLGWHRVGVITN